VDNEIRTQIIHEMRDKRLRRRALWESFTLQELLNHGRSLEHTDDQAKRLEGDQSQTPLLQVNAVDSQPNQSHFPHNNSRVAIQHVDSQVHAILTKHSKLSSGTGNLKNTEVKLEINESVTPVAQPSRRIPHRMKAKVNAKLEEMRNEGIIEKV